MSTEATCFENIIGLSRRDCACAWGLPVHSNPTTMAVKFQGGRAVALKATGGKPKAPFMREPVHRLGDGFYMVEPTIGELGDQEVAAAFREVKQAYNKFITVLNRKAIWD